jgi:hypothetical protein
METRMSEYLDQARRYHMAIRKILMEEWDPIGVAGIPGAEDEYDGSVSQIHILLIHREPLHELVDYLWMVDYVAKHVMFSLPFSTRMRSFSAVSAPHNAE